MNLIQIENFDSRGFQTLQTISKADKFNKWIYKQLKPWTQGKILEIGSGIGNISKHLIDDQKDLVLSDYNKQYVDYLKGAFPQNEVIQLDVDAAHG